MVPSLAQYAIFAVSLILGALTVLPLLRIPHGLVRGPEFARIQFAAAAVLLVPLAALALDGPMRVASLLCLAIAVFTNVGIFLKFTPIWPKQSLDPDPKLAAQTDRHITLLTANVKMSNRDYARLVDLVRSEVPDVFAALETDQSWIDALAPIKEDYAHSVEKPLDTGYGIAVYSRLPFLDVQVRDMVTDGVPSVRATVKLRSGDAISLYILHPEPPVPEDWTTGRDSEIATAGLEAGRLPLPAIIAGDLNDVAWSHTTRRFQRVTGLLDPRVGRGFYNTFNAFHPMFRWPLDHLFHDAFFRLITMKRLPKIGSDHFPMSFTLALAHRKDGDVPDAYDGEHQTVTDMIAAEKGRERGPVGTDWEADS